MNDATDRYEPPALQLYSVREPFAADPVATLDRVAELGFRGLELWNIVDNLQPLREGLRRTGLSAPTAHARLTDGDPEPAFAAAVELGVAIVIEPYLAPERWQAVEDVTASAAQLNELAVRAAEHGLRVGYHNHWWELKSRIGGRSAFEVFVDHLDAAVAVEVDTYWAKAGGADPVALLRGFGERTHAIHVKDGDLSHDGSGQVPAGRGGLPVAEILAAAPNALRVVEFDHYDGDIFDAVAASLAHLGEVDR